MIPKPKAILFDLGDTILEQTKFDADAGSKHLLALANNPRRVKVEQIQKLAEELNSEIQQRREEAQLEFPVTSFQRLLYERLDICFDMSPEAIAREFWNVANGMCPEPGVRLMLGSLESSEVRRAIISNSVFPGFILEEELEKHDLLHFFEFLISSADYGFRKPHSNVFLTALGETWIEGRGRVVCR